MTISDEPAAARTDHTDDRNLQFCSMLLPTASVEADLDTKPGRHLLRRSICCIMYSKDITVSFVTWQKKKKPETKSALLPKNEKYFALQTFQELIPGS